jgi:hypothetical protein
MARHGALHRPDRLEPALGIAPAGRSQPARQAATFGASKTITHSRRSSSSAASGQGGSVPQYARQAFPAHGTAAHEALEKP